MIRQCESVVVTCIDYRLQKIVDSWLARQLGHGTYDRIGLAGAVKEWETVSSQINLAVDLHGITKVVLINHEDCGAYGEDDTRRRHEADLKEARRKLLEEYPRMDVEIYYARIGGGIDVVS